MDAAEKLMHEHLADPSRIFVFPSEVASDHALKRLLKTGNRVMLPGTKCLSWDRFKEKTLVFPSDKRPANEYTRLFFLNELLEENSRRPVFRAIIRQEYASHSLSSASSLKRLLPLLQHTMDALRTVRGAIKSEKFHDLALLYARYTQFLDTASLYEPNFLQPVFRKQGKNYLIFYPEVIADFEHIASAFRNDPTVKLVPVPSPAAFNKWELVVYPSVKEELRRLCLAIHSLLDEGVPGDDIIISAANPDEIIPLLESEAALHDIRLKITEARPLLTYPGVQFLNQIGQIVSTNYRLDAITALLYNQSLPWKQELAIDELIRFGRTFNCMCNYTLKEELIDIWEFQFNRLASSHQRVPFLLNAVSLFYRSLRTFFQAITQASSFHSLKTAVTSFMNAFLSIKDFGKSENLNWQLALRILDELAETSRLLPLKKPASPFSLWLSVLEETPYVRPEKKSGVSVYPYRVSAGIMPRHHFIINTSEAATRTIIRQFPFLSVDEEAALTAPEKDSSDAFLSLYLTSGENVSVSVAKHGLRGIQLPPASFIEHGRIIEGGPDASSDQTDSYRQESLFWSDPDAWPPRLVFSLQKKGLAGAAVTHPLSLKGDFTQSSVTNEALRLRIEKILCNEQNFLAVSPTALERFSGCAFRFLLEQTAGLSELKSDFFQNDTRWYGTLIHRIFQEFNSRCSRGDGLFRHDKREEHQAEMAAVVERVVSCWEQEEAIPLPPLWLVLKAKLAEGFRRFLEIEAETFGSYKIIGVEQWLTARWEKERMALAGRIDRMGETEHGLRIVDYKKKSTPAKGDLALSSGEPVSFQIPFYIMLAEDAGGKVEAASYYSFERQRYEHVLYTMPHAKAFFTREEIEPIIAFMKGKILVMAERIRAGDFTIDKPATACTDCPLRPVCRNKYFLRL